jgi:hypothetical protein
LVNLLLDLKHLKTLEGCAKGSDSVSQDVLELEEAFKGYQVHTIVKSVTDVISRLPTELSDCPYDEITELRRLDKWVTDLNSPMYIMKSVLSNVATS